MDLDDFLRFDWIANEWMVVPLVLVALAVYLLLREWLFRMVDAVVRAACLVGRFFARIWRWCVGNPVTLFRWAVVVLLGGIFWCLCPKCKHEGGKQGERIHSSGMRNIRIK